MSIVSSTSKSKTKVICHVPTANHFEDVKPIEVKCFLTDPKLPIETEKSPTDVTATMMTIVPQRKRPISVPMKKHVVTDMVVGKPIRHLAILPSSKEQVMKESMKYPTNLSETFTMYEGPATTPVVGRSLSETLTMHAEDPILDANCEISINIDELNLGNDTTISSACELLDQSKLQSKPHSLIGRYQIPPPLPVVHIATVQYGATEPPEAANKQVLIQQFYNQLEKMKTTFNTDPSPQLTTNTLTFADGQVKQSSAANQLREKTIVKRQSSANVLQKNEKPPISIKQRTTKNPSTRIQSAPVTMATCSNKIRKPTPFSSCKQVRNPLQQKKSAPIKEKPLHRIESAPPAPVEFRTSEVTLLPHEEHECRQMFEKLQRLQPNGACADLNTLRRALYPPVGTTTYSSNLHYPSTTSSPFKSYRQRIEEMPQSWIKVDDKYVSQHVPKPQPISNESHSTIPTENTDLDRIADQMKKHAAINYSYYTRTK